MDESHGLISHQGRPLDDQPTEAIYLTQGEFKYLLLAIADSIGLAKEVLGVLTTIQKQPNFEEALKREFGSRENAEAMGDTASRLINTLPRIAEEIIEAIQILEAMPTEEKPKIITDS